MNECPLETAPTCQAMDASIGRQTSSLRSSYPAFSISGRTSQGDPFLAPSVSPGPRYAPSASSVLPASPSYSMRSRSVAKDLRAGLPGPTSYDVPPPGQSRSVGISGRHSFGDPFLAASRLITPAPATVPSRHRVGGGAIGKAKRFVPGRVSSPGPADYAPGVDPAIDASPSWTIRGRHISGGRGRSKTTPPSHRRPPAPADGLSVLSSMGSQAVSDRPSSPSWSFGRSKRFQDMNRAKAKCDVLVAPKEYALP
jgi:hypothetical protein